MSEENVNRAKVLAEKIKNNPHCPKCGKKLEDGTTVRVSDFCLNTGTATVENGGLEDYHLEPTEIWEDEEEITCPHCRSSFKAEEGNIDT